MGTNSKNEISSTGALESWLGLSAIKAQCHQHTHHPIVVEKGELVCEALVAVWVQVGVVVDEDVVRGWGDGAFGYPLTHQEKVIPTGEGNVGEKVMLRSFDMLLRA